MCEYTKIKAVLEKFKCPTHGKSATVSFVTGKMMVGSYCCEEHRLHLNENLADAMERNVADIISEVF